MSKFCVDCSFRRRTFQHYYGCINYQVRASYASAVHGVPDVVSCFQARGAGVCGPEGKEFFPKKRWFCGEA